jgi:Putative Flp pilus-assembly TadE/G-like
MKIVSKNKGEQGQTIVLVAVSLFAILSMAALAIDVTTLYVASTEAQQAADAAALAGAKVFVTSGYTSYPAGFATTDVCNGSNGLADYAAQSALASNTVSGVAPTMTTSCDFSDPENPRITVRVTRSALPVFFARIWGARSPSASSTATAEAYNPSGGSVPIQSAGVKPWLLPNCNPFSTTAAGNSKCPVGGGATNYYDYFVDPTTGSILNARSFIGQSITLQPGGATQLTLTPPEIDFYALNIPQNSPMLPLCPACANTNHGPYRDGIQCFNPTTFSCGQPINDGAVNDASLNPSIGTGVLKNNTDSGTQCLDHQTAYSGGFIPPDCSLGPYEQDCFIANGPANPILIIPGSQNPDSSLAGATYISRSDSVVTVPLFDGRDLCPGPPPNCAASLSNSAPVVGFLELGVQASVSNGVVQAVILNASGCSSTPLGSPVSGGNLSSIPVRLIQTP